MKIYSASIILGCTRAYFFFYLLSHLLDGEQKTVDNFFCFSNFGDCDLPDAKRINVKIAKDSQNITVSVEDFGIGIAPDHLQSIFERFNQVSPVDSETDANLGLGLYIAKEIVARHGGRIWVESKPGKGSIFYFTLPRK